MFPISLVLISTFSYKHFIYVPIYICVASLQKGPHVAKIKKIDFG